MKLSVLFVIVAGIVSAQIPPIKLPPAALSPPSTSAPTGSLGHLSPIPLYFPATITSPEFVNQFVFLEPNTWDVVVSFPGNVDDPAFAQHPASRTNIYVELNKHVQPFLFVSFGRDNTDNNTYSYSVLNRRDARQPIRSWTLNVPFRGNPPADLGNASVVAGSPIVLTHGASWLAATSPPSRGIVQVNWSASTPAAHIAVGATGGGFTVSSALKPGFVEAYAEGYSAGVKLNQLDVPSKVKAQILALEQGGFNRQIVLTIGPKFEPDAPRVAIAADFAHGIDVLIRNGYLDAASSFVKEASEQLRAYLAGAQFAPDIPAREYIVPSISITAIPAAGFEAQIYQAMKISLELP